MNMISGFAGLVLRKDEHITMRVVKEDSMMVQRWTGYVPSAVYREIMDESIAHATHFGLRRWFADLREMGAILQNDELWTKEEWFPRLAATRVGRMAFVMSSDYFNQMSVDRIMSVGTAVMPLDVGYFGDMEEARAWLLSTEMATVPA
jgi:hypothetical protein